MFVEKQEFSYIFINCFILVANEIMAFSHVVVGINAFWSYMFIVSLSEVVFLSV